MDDAQREKIVEEWFEEKLNRWFSGKPKTTKTYVKNVYKNSGGGLYCVGMIGAAVYYVGAATSFWMGVLGLLKACFWPAFLVYEALKLLGA